MLSGRSQLQKVTCCRIPFMQNVQNRQLHTKQMSGCQRFEGAEKRVFTQLSPILCDPTDCNQPGFTVQRILQARILEWIAISFSPSAFEGGDKGE